MYGFVFLQSFEGDADNVVLWYMADNDVYRETDKIYVVKRDCRVLL